MSRGKGSLYCVAHTGDLPERVVCPMDPSHTVWKSKLKSHVRKCIVRNDSESSDPWFKLDINSGPTAHTHVESVDWQMQCRTFISSLVENFNQQFSDAVPLRKVEFKNGLEERFKEVSNQKHILQQSCLIGQLAENSLLSSDVCYVEFGCGRAEFSRYLSRCQESSSFLLIDRSLPRMKMDKKILEDYRFSGNPPRIERIKIDIKDLVLDSAMDELQLSGKVVAISKHLCGVATDLTLRCILNSRLDNFAGCVIALCCRHCCSYKDLLQGSKDFLSDKFGIGEMEFELFLKKLCSWATCGRPAGLQDEEGSNHFSGMSVAEREKVGLMARRVVDEARAFAMEQSGFQCSLFNYVESDVSLENCCLVVTRNPEPEALN